MSTPVPSTPERNDAMLKAQGVTDEQLLEPLVIDSTLRGAEEHIVSATEEAEHEPGEDYAVPDDAPPELATHDNHDPTPDVPES
jgi:hypothetical protein